MSGIDLGTLSDEQRRIVTTLDEPLFVEAGAGSGKTFTLTRRVAWALSPGSGTGGRPFLDDLSQVLVITFTNAAAREIRERVRSTLREAGMREQALQVDSAWISTIHGMCSRILRRHALDLGLDPEFKVVGENDARAIEARALEDVVGAAYQSALRGSALREAFDEYQLGSRGPSGYSGVEGVVQSIRAAARSVPAGYDGLAFPEGDDVSELMGRLANDVLALGSRKLGPKSAEKVARSAQALEDFLALAPGQRTAKAALDTLSAVVLPASAKSAAEELSCAKASLVEARASVELARPRAWAAELVGLARRVDERVAELERDRSVLSNDDLVELALRAVRENEAVARDYAGHFRLVMVDEFQDTDSRQLELIEALAGDGARHLATVGDAQQSIYRFRGADVGVFRGRGRDLPEEEHVRLAVNYRSHADVLSLVDRACGGEAGVLDEFMHLDPSPTRKDAYRARDLPRIDLEVTVGSGNRGHVSGRQAAVAAAAVADRLAEYAAHGERPGDMALLLGTTTQAALYIDAIRARGLDCVVTGGSTFTSAPEVRTVAKLLHALANPRDTQSGLFPLLTSEMFELDAADLVQLGTRPQRVLDAPTNRSIDRGLETMDFYREAAPSVRLSRAHDVLGRAREALRRLPVADVCLQVVRESGWLSRLEREGAEGAAREANVLAAIGYVRDLTEQMGLGPARAATEFDTWLEASKIPPASLAGGSSSSVRVMTIHASKGLEFPVCAVAECWSRRPDSGKLRFAAKDGLASCVLVPREPPKGLKGLEVDGRPTSLAEWCCHIANANDAADAAEKSRLLYVALTRAREALVVGVNVSSSNKRGLQPQLGVDFLGALFPGGVPEAGQHRFDYGGSEDGRVRVAYVDKGEEGFSLDAAGTLPIADGPLPAAGPLTDEGASSDGAEGPAGGAGTGEFLIFPEERDQSASLATTWSPREGVYSFSSAHEQMREAFDSPGTEPADVTGARGPASGSPRVPTRAERDAQQEGAPVTDDEDRATNLGSAFHELAQCLVERGSAGRGAGQDPPRAGLPEGRVEATAAHWRLSPRNVRRLRDALARWEGSDLRREVLSHKVVRAEVPFFSRADSRFGAYVEGAIDLLAWDPGSTHALLVDYKTGDRGLTADEVRQRHQMQANFYASVLMGEGYESVECCFVCVELEDASAPGQPFVVRYLFDGSRPLRI